MGSRVVLCADEGSPVLSFMVFGRRAQDQSGLDGLDLLSARDGA
jgi:hypothetical protein